jgi:2'-5' RNA ligase
MPDIIIIGVNLCYAIELSFNLESERTLYNLALSINDHGITNKFIDMGNTPHIALSVYDDIDIEKAIELINRFPIYPFFIDLQGIGTFPGDENTIFLIPKVSKELLEIQSNFYNHFIRVPGCQSYYHPDRWVPHCTLGIDIESDNFKDAFEIVRKEFSPIRVRVEKIILIKFRPVEVLFERKI